MKQITLGTNWIRFDEPCAGLYELDYQSPGSKGFHRYQIALVVRDDKVYEYRKDLGKTKKFKGVDQIRIPGGTVDQRTGKIQIAHTVGQLMDIVDKLRAGKSLFDKRELIGVNRIRET
jgi:hypothetical protein